MYLKRYLLTYYVGKYHLDIKSKLLRMYSFAVYLHTDDTD